MGSSGSWGESSIWAFGPSIAGSWFLTGGLVWLGAIAFGLFAGIRAHKNGFFTDGAPENPEPPLPGMGGPSDRETKRRHLRSIK